MMGILLWLPPLRHKILEGLPCHILTYKISALSFIKVIVVALVHMADPGV
jgi:hypothetical protein